MPLEQTAPLTCERDHLTSRPRGLQAAARDEHESNATSAGPAATSPARTGSAIASRPAGISRPRHRRKKADEPLSPSKLEHGFKNRMTGLKNKLRDLSKATGAQWVLAAAVDLPATARQGPKLQAVVYGTPNMRALLLDETGESVNTRTLHAFTGDLLGSEPKQFMEARWRKIVPMNIRNKRKELRVLLDDYLDTVEKPDEAPEGPVFKGFGKPQWWPGDWGGNAIDYMQPRDMQQTSRRPALPAAMPQQRQNAPSQTDRLLPGPQPAAGTAMQQPSYERRRRLSRHSQWQNNARSWPDDCSDVEQSEEQPSQQQQQRSLPSTERPIPAPFTATQAADDFAPPGDMQDDTGSAQMPEESPNQQQQQWPLLSPEAQAEGDVNPVVLAPPAALQGHADVPVRRRLHRQPEMQVQSTATHVNNAGRSHSDRAIVGSSLAQLALRKPSGSAALREGDHTPVITFSQAQQHDAFARFRAARQQHGGQILRTTQHDDGTGQPAPRRAPGSTDQAQTAAQTAAQGSVVPQACSASQALPTQPVLAPLTTLAPQAPAPAPAATSAVASQQVAAQQAIVLSQQLLAVTSNADSADQPSALASPVRRSLADPSGQARRNPLRVRNKPGKLRGSSAYAAARPARALTFRCRTDEAWPGSAASKAAVDSAENQDAFVLQHAMIPAVKLEHGVHFHLGDRQAEGYVFLFLDNKPVPFDAREDLSTDQQKLQLVRMWLHMAQEALAQPEIQSTSSMSADAATKAVVKLLLAAGLQDEQIGLMDWDDEAMV